MSQQTTLRRYQGRFVTVTYDAKRCLHAAECVRGLPAVFRRDAKPWVDPDSADADAVAAVVDCCPTGALRVECSGEPAEAVPANNTATLTARGPAYLRGDLALMAQDGSAAVRDTRMALCRCGGSGNKPFCDGSHAKLGFSDDGTLRAPETPAPASSGGRVEIRARRNGPLMLTGPLTVVGTNGRTAFNETMFFCRCGASGNKPYCDGMHTKTGFVS